MNQQISVTDFLTPFFPDENEQINLRLFKAKTAPKDATNETLKKRTSRAELQTNQRLKAALKQENKTRGVYFVVNSGGDSDSTITRYNAFFVENDNLSIAEQHAALDACPLKPSIRIETLKSVHAYWLIVESERNLIDEQTFRDVQTNLVKYFSGDEKNINPSRVFRLPFFNHVLFDGEKYEYKKVELVEFEPMRRYTLAQMLEALQAAPNNAEQPEQQTAPNNPTNNNQPAQSEFQTHGERNLELANRVKLRAKKNRKGVYEMRCPVHNGNGETSLTVIGEAVSCSSGCDYFSLLSAFGLSTKRLPAFKKKPKAAKSSPEKQPAPNLSQNPTTQAERLIALTDSLELFHTETRDCYAVIEQSNGAPENVKISSIDFRLWLNRQFWNDCGKSASRDALKSAIENLHGKALYESAMQKTFVRIAETSDGKTYVDLVDAKRTIIEVDENGFRAIDAESCPVRFIRKNGMLPQPFPKAGGNFDDLKAFVNVHENDFVLLKSWLVACFRNDKPFPVAAFHGEQGSAKSSTSRFVRELVDPNACALRPKPKDERDLMIAADNSFIVGLDNLSFISDELSDGLCRLATGNGFATRKLHTDGEEIMFSSTRPILINGIEELASRPDLIERSLIFICPRIEPKKRKLERTLKAAFEKAKPHLFGALLELVATAKRNLPNLPEMEFPRMADFAEFACATFGDEFTNRYTENRESATTNALDASIVASKIVEFMQDKTTWTGTPTDLFFEICRITDDATKRLKSFPKAANLLSGHITRYAAALRSEGIYIERDRNNAKRGVLITKAAPDSVRDDEMTMQKQASSSPSSPISTNKNGRGDDGDDGDAQKSHSTGGTYKAACATCGENAATCNCVLPF